MNRSDFTRIMGRLQSAYPGLETPGREAQEVWWRVLEPIDVLEAEKAVERIHRDHLEMPPWTNRGALVLKYCRPQLTEATVQERLLHAHALLCRGDCAEAWRFLEQLHPDLPRMAEDGGAMDRLVSQDSLRHATREVARQLAEKIENAARGFQPPEAPAGMTRRFQLPAPETCTNPAEAKKHLAHLRLSLDRIRQKSDGLALSSGPVEVAES